LRIAVLIDSLEVRGGGEKIALHLAKKYDGEIYTSKVVWENILPEFKELKVNVVGGQIPSVPFLAQEAMLRGFRKLDLSDYDATVCLGAGYTYYTAERNHPTIWYTFGISPLFYKNGPRTWDYWSLGGLQYRPAVLLWRTRMRGYDKRIVGNLVDKIVAVSHYTGTTVKEYYGRPAEVIPPPMDDRRFINKRDEGYYLVVARLVPEKRIDLVINAFRKMPDKTLWIEGTGPTESYLKKLSEGSKNIKFLGRVGSDELLDLYAKCIALVSMDYYQGYCTVIIEAFASGKPCILVNQGGYSELVTEGVNGTLVGEEVSELVKGVARMTPDVAARMKEACLEKAKEFTLSSFYGRWGKILGKGKD
jgi:glycosyltransferase involved in cell wall biosynthesis